MEEIITVFHGSNVAVCEPCVLIFGLYKDFGFGFYCTSIENQAGKWAKTRKGNSVVSVFGYKQYPGLKILSFPVHDRGMAGFCSFMQKGNRT